jgi:hypothetical protein
MSEVRYSSGTLSYTKRALFVLFGWLLCGDFCLVMMETVVPAVLSLNARPPDAPNWVKGKAHPCGMRALGCRRIFSQTANGISSTRGHPRRDGNPLEMALRGLHSLPGSARSISVKESRGFRSQPGTEPFL